ncbi:MAG TPA: septal ring lytic transglycosylase RlpA family protein [Cycloclasticus sp.]|nr:septal ring lytic transglycosylase RlpA family protein [Cycloclasticus sp.]
MRLFIILMAAYLIIACGSQKPFISDGAPLIHPDNLELTPNAIPRVEAKSRGGNPISYDVFGKTYHVMPSSEGFLQRGIASWYGTKFHGNKTSNGETYNMYAMTAAHKTLPIPSYVEVTDLDNGKKIVVRVNDRGPFHKGRIIDLSYAAATKLGTLKHGTSNVEIRVVKPRSNTTTTLESSPHQLIEQKPSNSVDKKPLLSPINSTNKEFLFIQVGAFSSLENATKIKHQLINELNASVSVKPNTTNPNPLYLVRVGPYIRIKRADLARLQLHKLGFKNIIYATE